MQIGKETLGFSKRITIFKWFSNEVTKKPAPDAIHSTFSIRCGCYIIFLLAEMLCNHHLHILSACHFALTFCLFIFTGQYLFRSICQWFEIFWLIVLSLVCNLFEMWLDDLFQSGKTLTWYSSFETIYQILDCFNTFPESIQLKFRLFESSITEDTPIRLNSWYNNQIFKCIFIDTNIQMWILL